MPWWLLAVLARLCPPFSMCGPGSCCVGNEVLCVQAAPATCAVAPALPRPAPAAGVDRALRVPVRGALLLFQDAHERLLPDVSPGTSLPHRAPHPVPLPLGSTTPLPAEWSPPVTLPPVITRPLGALQVLLLWLHGHVLRRPGAHVRGRGLLCGRPLLSHAVPHHQVRLSMSSGSTPGSCLTGSGAPGSRHTGSSAPASWLEGRRRARQPSGGAAARLVCMPPHSSPAASSHVGSRFAGGHNRGSRGQPPLSTGCSSAA